VHGEFTVFFTLTTKAIKPDGSDNMVVCRLVSLQDRVLGILIGMFLGLLTIHQRWPPMGAGGETAALRSLGMTHILALTSDQFFFIVD
jgi:hypothetical protein